MPIVAGVPQEERAKIDAVERRLAQKYADLPHDDIAAVIQHAYARFNQSTVRDYVPLLVERRANEQLARSTARREAVDERRPETLCPSRTQIASIRVSIVGRAAPALSLGNGDGVSSFLKWVVGRGISPTPRRQ
jgi:hypothetical protein